MAAVLTSDPSPASLKLSDAQVPASEVREQLISDFRELLMDAQAALGQSPERWAKELYKVIATHEIALRRHPESYSEPIRAFLQDYLPLFKTHLRSCANDILGGGSSTVTERALHMIHEFSEELFKIQGDRINLKTQIQTVTFDKLVQSCPNQIQVTDDKIIVLGHEFPRPQSEDLLHKGGLPRVLVKLLARAPAHTIATELPANDLDVIIRSHSAEAEAEVKALDIGKDGVEVVESLDFAAIFNSRDLDLNGCVVSREGLHFADWTFKAAQSGEIHLIPAIRGLYGKDFFTDTDGTQIAKDRGLARLVKAVVEGKADSFEIVPRNLQVDLGIYWLILARRFVGKQNGEQLLNRMWDISEQMGSRREGEKGIYDILDRVHAKYPFFSFNDKALDETGVVRWLSGKVGQQVERLFKRTLPYEFESNLERRDGDTVLTKIVLPPLHKISSGQEFAQGWKDYLDRCEARRSAYQEKIKAISTPVAVSGNAA